MEYVREITDSNKLLPLFDLPQTMHNKRVEVIILPIDDTTIKPNTRSLRGALSRFAKPELKIRRCYYVWSI